MKKNKLIVLSIVALLGLGTIGVTNEFNNVTAKAEITKVAKKKHKKQVTKKAARKNIKNQNQNNKSSQNNSAKQSDTVVNGQDTKTGNVVDTNAYYTAFKNEVLSEINNLRTQQGLNTVQTTSVLNNIADQRASQVSVNDDSFTHYDSNGKAFVNELAAQNGLYSTADAAQPHMAENLTQTTITGNPIDDAKSLMDTFISEGPNNGDGHEHGHYENIIDSTHTGVGIGVKLTRDNTVTTLVLDFQSLGKSNMVM